MEAYDAAESVETGGKFEDQATYDLGKEKGSNYNDTVEAVNDVINQLPQDAVADLELIVADEHAWKVSFENNMIIVGGDEMTYTQWTASNISDWLGASDDARVR